MNIEKLGKMLVENKDDKSINNGRVGRIRMVNFAERKLCVDYLESSPKQQRQEILSLDDVTLIIENDGESPCLPKADLQKADTKWLEILSGKRIL